MFANFVNSWSTRIMKNTGINLKEKLISKYTKNSQIKTSNINVLLNRIEINKKSESRKKIYFSAAASAGLVLFGIIIF